MRTLLGGMLLALGMLVVPVRTSAQQRPDAPPRTAAQRDSLELRVRQRMDMMLRTQLGLSDEQLGRLQAMSRRFEPQRRALFQQERETRASLRQLVAAGDTTAADQITALLDRIVQLQRQRVALLESEQRELASFMTPMQRARYFGLEEQIRRRMEEMRDQAPPGVRRPASPPPGRPGQPGTTRRPES